MKKGIIVVSFGTSCDETREKNIGAVENDIAEAFPEAAIERAFTSSLIVQNLKRRGISVNLLEEALEKLYQAGCTHVFLQPTHIIPGEEYWKLIHMAENHRNQFKELLIGMPLLSSQSDFEDVIQIMTEEIRPSNQEAVVLMGHGTPHSSNTTYAAMDYMLKEKEFGSVFIGTVEAYPDIHTVLKLVQKAGYRKVKLMPFMLVAGDHAIHDMAGEDEDSWKNMFLSHGFEVECVLKGLGEYPKIRALYIKHMKDEMLKSGKWI